MFVGRITKWLVAEENDGIALFRCLHDDGDEEDLEEYEVLDTTNLSPPQPPA